MIVSCSAPQHSATTTLLSKLQAIGLHPAVANGTISVLYTGDDEEIGGAIVEIFAHEADHQVSVRQG